MNEQRLRGILEQGKGHTDKSINSRISRAKKAEDILGVDLDYIVTDDYKMYWALIKLRDSGLNVSGNLTNAVRWYYRAVNGRVFPRLDAYEWSMKSR